MSARATRSGMKRKSDLVEESSTSHSAKPSKSARKAPTQPRASSKDVGVSKESPQESPIKESTESKKDKNLQPTETSNNANDKPSKSSAMLTINESKGDIFDAPEGTLIIHACNCEGSWGAGIAAAFRENYPSAFTSYQDHCLDHGYKLFGTALLIPPQDRDEHFVGCLFTSRSKGKKKDSPEKILKGTGPAMQDLLKQVKEWNESKGESERVKEVRMCKINSGLFAVPWEKTKKVLEGIEVGNSGVKVVEVIDRE